ncbi:MAG: glutathione S-transferase N-terminal domain-containing protein [Gammaproteobacteria bacterium]|nr:glutathione S-transferase N-terminal domain-containing protein [Gammaproteobacteria bacterium]
MIDLYTWKTPNGHKAPIMLEELGLEYTVHPVNLGKDEQFEPEFLKISPGNKIPAIVDHDTDSEPIAVFESAAILVYLAEKTGSPLLPEEPRRRASVLAWSMFQIGSVGPMLGQLEYFTRFAEEKVPEAIERYRKEGKRILQVMERRLSGTDYLAGEYSIADILCYPWLRVVYDESEADLPDVFEHTGQLRAWLERVGRRPAVERGMRVPKLA